MDLKEKLVVDKCAFEDEREREFLLLNIDLHKNINKKDQVEKI
jgi:hypothetical protein